MACHQLATLYGTVIRWLACLIYIAIVLYIKTVQWTYERR
jgi:hypothetical protein